jgi:hypothetical protein
VTREARSQTADFELAPDRGGTFTLEIAAPRNPVERFACDATLDLTRCSRT